MSRFPDEVKYTPAHLWVRLSDGREVRVGGTPDWLGTLGMLVHSELPIVGTVIAQGDHVGRVGGPTDELVVVAPLSGVVSAVNQAVVDDPDLARREAFGEGWLFEVEVADAAEDQDLGLLDAEAYEQLVDAESAGVGEA